MARDRVAGDEGLPAPKLGERLQQRFVRPAQPGIPDNWDIPTDPAELEELHRRANDKERAVGAIGAPIAAGISFIVVHILTVDDPAHYLKSGAVNPKYTSPSTLDELLLVMLGLSVVILLSAMLRKRLFLGIAFALFGLSIFNIHQYGFGIPFILAGAWLLVRSYRLSRAMKTVTASAASPSARRGQRANKRYTPPAKRWSSRP